MLRRRLPTRRKILALLARKGKCNPPAGKPSTTAMMLERRRKRQWRTRGAERSRLAERCAPEIRRKNPPTCI